jgi:hypothetical protein
MNNDYAHISDAKFVCSGKIKALEEENRGDHGEETSQIAIGRRHQK